MKGAWCYDWEIKCALGRFYCACGLCCTYSSSPWCVWPCVLLRVSQGLYEQSHLGSEHHLLDEGWLLAVRLQPLSYRHHLPRQCCAQLPGLGLRGCRGHGQLRVKALRRTGFFLPEILQIFIALEALLFYFLTLESSYSSLRVLWCLWKSCSTVWE